jgi:hypothetical protein
MEAAITSLRELGEGLTRDKLLDLVIEAPNENRVDAYISLVRQGMDYEFFQLMSGKIEAAEGDEKKRMEDLRSHILEVTEEIDQEVQARLGIAKQNLDKLLEQENIPETTLANLHAIDDFFIQVLNQEFAAAREAKDTDRETRLKQVIETIAEVSRAAAGPDSELLQTLIDTEDVEARKQMMEENADKINQQFMEALSALLVQLDGPDNVEMADKVRKVYREAVRFSMQANLQEEQ